MLSSNTSFTCPHNMVNFSLPAAKIVSLVWGTPANFNGFRILASLLQRRRSTEANQTFHNVWPLPWLIDYIYTFSAAVVPYYQRYCTAVEQPAPAKLCGVEHRAPPIFGRATITLGTGPHSSYYLLLCYTPFTRHNRLSKPVASCKRGFTNRSDSAQTQRCLVNVCGICRPARCSD